MMYLLCSTSGMTKRIRITSGIQAFNLLNALKRASPAFDYSLHAIY